jgi:hypothetical protein
MSLAAMVEGLARDAVEAALRAIEAWNEQDHPRDDHGRFTDKGGVPARHTPAGHAAKLANAGYRLYHAGVGPSDADEWHYHGKLNGDGVLVRPYGHGGAKYAHQVKLQGVDKDGNTFYKGHQINQLLQENAKRHPPEPGVAPPKPVVPRGAQPAKAAPAKAAPAVQQMLLPGQQQKIDNVVSPAVQQKLAAAGFTAVRVNQDGKAVFNQGDVQLQIGKGDDGKPNYQILQSGKALGGAVAHRPFDAQGNLRPDIAWAVNKGAANFGLPVKKGAAPPNGLVYGNSAKALATAGFIYRGVATASDGSRRACYETPDKSAQMYVGKYVGYNLFVNGKQVNSGGQLYDINHNGEPYLKQDIREAAGLPKPKFDVDPQQVYQSLISKDDRSALDRAGFTVKDVKFNEGGDPTLVLSKGDVQIRRAAGKDLKVFQNGIEVNAPGWRGWRFRDQWGNLDKPLRDLIGMPDPDLKIPTHLPSSDKTSPPVNLVGDEGNRLLTGRGGFTYVGVGRDSQGGQYAKYQNANGVTLRVNDAGKTIAVDKNGNKLGEWTGVPFERNNNGQRYLLPDFRQAVGIPDRPYNGANAEQDYKRATSAVQRDALAKAGFVLDGAKYNEKEEPVVVLRRPDGAEMQINSAGYQLKPKGQQAANPVQPMYQLMDKFGFLNQNIRQTLGLPQPDLRLPVTNPDKDTRPDSRLVSRSADEAFQKAGFVYMGNGRDKDGNDFAQYIHPAGAILRKQDGGDFYITPPGGKEVALNDDHPYERDSNRQAKLKMTVREAAGLPTWWLSAPPSKTPPVPQATPQRPIPSPSIQPDLPMTLPPHDEMNAIERELAQGKSSGSSRMGGGVNETVKVQLENGMKCVFKPNDGEDKFCAGGWNIEVKAGAQAMREVAAYQVAKLVGMKDLVPPTVYRNQNGKMGIIHPFAEGETAGNVGEAKRYDGDRDCARCAAFDYVIADGDRHNGNWICQGDGPKIQLIDHGMCFPNGDKMQNVRGFLVKMKNDKDDINGLRPRDMAAPFVDKKNEIIGKMSKLGFSKEAIHGVAARIDDLATARKWEDLKY